MKEIIIISIALILISKILNKRERNREKISMYECGFQSFDNSRRTYYIKYYIVGILFLIFDLETMLLYPISYLVENINNQGYIIYIVFMKILILGLIYELKKGII